MVLCSLFRSTVRWRKDFGIESLLEEDLDTDLDKIVFLHGFDKKVTPMANSRTRSCIRAHFPTKRSARSSSYGVFSSWRRASGSLISTPMGLTPLFRSTISRICPDPSRGNSGRPPTRPCNCSRIITLSLSPSRMISPFLTQRTKSKFVFAAPSKSAETLFKYIAPKQVPAQYGGLSREGEQEFTTADPVTEETIKHIVEFPISEVT
ncbi:hypothetical protein U1Q18_026730 [Sarracenia purpurea var. burkii]